MLPPTRWLISFIALIVLLLPPAARADEPRASDDTSQGGGQTEPPDARLQELVRQLGDTSFDVREHAARELTRHGLAAKSALQEGMESVDLEIRMRSHQILVRTMNLDFERRLAAFIDDDQNRAQHDLPSWDRFRQVAGDDRASRKLFAEMLRQEPGLLDASETGPAAVEETFNNRVREVQTQTFGAFNGIYAERSVHPATLATLLFVGASASDSSSASLLYSLLNQSTMKEAVNGGQHSRVMKRLLENWILASDGTSQAYYGLLLTLNYNLRESALTLGRRHLKEQQPSSTVLQYAAIALGRFGDKSDVELLEKHLDNETVCHTWSNRQLKEGLIRIQIRDIVLCMLVHVTGQNPRTYGFNLLQENPMTLYHIYTFGFLEDNERDAALAKWKKWRAGGGDANADDKGAEQGPDAANGAGAAPGEPGSGTAPAVR